MNKVKFISIAAIVALVTTLSFNRRLFMKKTKGFLLSAAFVLALAFIFSCSSGGGGGSESTYWYSAYGIETVVACNNISNLFRQYENNPSYDDIKYVWSEIKKIGIFMASEGGGSEQEFKDVLIQHDMSPKDADNAVAAVKKRGNAIIAFNSSSPYYSCVEIYFERE